MKLEVLHQQPFAASIEKILGKQYTTKFNKPAPKPPNYNGPFTGGNYGAELESRPRYKQYFGGGLTK